MKATYAATVIAAACALASQAQAAIYTFTGDTTGKPTYNRPFEDLSGLEPVGAGVHYDVVTFTASLSGTYSFLITGSYDSFATLYAGTFLPASPLANAIVANDDLLPGIFSTTGFGTTLTAGATYKLVITGYDSTEFGAYSATIGGPGIINLVPEPSAYAMLGLGLAGVGLRRRRLPAQMA